MFHVMTSYLGWGDISGQMPVGRVYLKPETIGTKFFDDNGALITDEIRKYPALLLQEPQAQNAQPARVAYIHSLHKSGKQYNIEYMIDTSIAPIPSDTMVELLSNVGISEVALNHSCWTMSNNDLFKILLRHEQKSKLKPTVFNFEALHQPDPNLISVMMPFSAEFTPVYEAIRQGVDEAGFICKRADDIWNNQHIIQDVVDLIASAHMVICDLSGKNSNVFYEAGIAHSLGKEIIIITQSMEDVPFDLKALRCLPYHNIGEGLQKLAASITQKLMI